jgi:multiple sugar transport system ATP-binding protein
MNFLEATLSADGSTLSGQGVSLPIPARLRDAVRGMGGARLVAGIRPEHVAPPGRAPRGESAAVPVTVEIAEPLGDEVVVHARAGEAALVFKQDPHRSAAIGSGLEVLLELDGLHLFDAESQVRIGT